MKTLAIFILGVMLGVFAAYKQFAGAQAASTFYITIPYAVPAGAAIRVKGMDRLDALSRISVTVWTAKEWQECTPCKDSLIIPRP